MLFLMMMITGYQQLELQINKMKEINSMFCITNSFIMCNRYNYKQFIDLDLGKLKNNNLMILFLLKIKC